MIVLDSASKSLTVENKSGTGGFPSTPVVVSYWSIDAAGLWTPHSYESTIVFGGSASPSTLTILPAPSGSEIRVVENVWIYFDPALVSTQYVKLQLTVLGVSRGLMYVEGGTFWTIPMVFVMKRDGCPQIVSSRW
jgi:hypothetical protein